MNDHSSYHIKLEGRLEPHWSAWFEGLSLRTDEAGHTVLSGTVPDQSALFGILLKIRDLGLPLVEVSRR